MQSRGFLRSIMNVSSDQLCGVWSYTLFPWKHEVDVYKMRFIYLPDSWNFPTVDSNTAHMCELVTSSPHTDSCAHAHKHTNLPLIMTACSPETVSLSYKNSSSVAHLCLCLSLSLSVSLAQSLLAPLSSFLPLFLSYLLTHTNPNTHQKRKKNLQSSVSVAFKLKATALCLWGRMTMIKWWREVAADTSDLEEAAEKQRK